MTPVDKDKTSTEPRDTGKTPEAERPRVRGTAVGGQYISPNELFTTKAGREAILGLIKTVEFDKLRARREA